MNFFRRHQDKPADEIEPPGEPSVLPKDEREEPKPTNTVEPIHVNAAEFEMLTRALHPESAPVLPDLKIDPLERKAPVLADEVIAPPPTNAPAVSSDWPQGTPIV